MSSKPHVLLPAAMSTLVERELDAAFTLHRLPADDRPAFLAEWGERIGGIATGGHHPKVDRALIEALPHLAIISNFGVGYDTVDVRAAADHGVIVTNTPQVLDDEVADTALGLLIATVRELPQAERHLREGRWLQGSYPLTRGSLRGRKVGLVGMGRIGQAIARRVEAFGLPVAYHSRHKRADVAYPYFPDLMELARAVDTLIVIVPGGAGTNGLINAAVLQALGPEGVLVNVARGSVVDEPALISALQNGTIMAAGLDVYADEPRVPAELISMSNVVLLPHVASASQRTRNAMGQLVVDNLLAWSRGESPLTPVAETPWPGRWKS